jgi:hypothetical protein
MTAKEFQEVITRSDGATGETLEIFYSDGTVVEGFVQSVNYNYDPPYVNLCKSSVRRGESSDHRVRFERILKLIIKPHNKLQKVYE